MKRLLVWSLAVVLVAPLAAQSRTENVVLIVTDGLRWQEVFRGAERRLISQAPGGVADTTALLAEFWRDDVAARRAALLPFLWGTVAREGTIYGDQDAGSIARITNTFKFSYPGYNELFTGWFDERIDSNDYPPNPNVTVFEWLNQQRGFEGRVGAVATWDAFTRILNESRAGIDVLDGWDAPFKGNDARDPRRAMVNEIYTSSLRYWPGNASDAPMQLAAKEYIRLKHPRLLFIGYGETDEWAHEGRYDLLLRSARQVDAFIAELWAMLQGMSQYRGRTTFIITTDHGRGGGSAAWKSHGARVDGAEDIWIALIGPDTPAGGVIRGGERVTQAQVAGTIASLLGLGPEYKAKAPRSAPSLTPNRPRTP